MAGNQNITRRRTIGSKGGRASTNKSGKKSTSRKSQKKGGLITRII